MTLVIPSNTHAPSPLTSQRTPEKCRWRTIEVGELFTRRCNLYGDYPPCPGSGLSKSTLIERLCCHSSISIQGDSFALPLRYFSWWQFCLSHFIVERLICCMFSLLAISLTPPRQSLEINSWRESFLCIHQPL